MVHGHLGFLPGPERGPSGIDVHPVKEKATAFPLVRLKRVMDHGFLDDGFLFRINFFHPGIHPVFFHRFFLTLF